MTRASHGTFIMLKHMVNVFQILHFIAVSLAIQALLSRGTSELDVSVEETIPTGMATRRFSPSLTSVCTKAPTTTGSRTAFQTSIPESGVVFQRRLLSSPTRTTGTNIETRRLILTPKGETRQIEPGVLSCPSSGSGRL